MSEFSNTWEGGERKGDLDPIETIHFKFVVLGGGNSAGYVAKSFVEYTDKKKNPLGVDLEAILDRNLSSTNTKAHKLAIISAESELPYERPALSKAYLNPPGKTQARLPGFRTCVGSGGSRQDEGFYKENGIELFLEHHAIDVDIDSQTIICDRKSDRKLIAITYDKLIIATGSRPLFTNMFDKADILENIFVLRNEVDASQLVQTLQKLHDKKDAKVIIIGGGYIGMECAAAFAGWDIDVTMIFPEDNLLSRVFTPELSAWYQKYLTDVKGVKIQKQMKVMKFLGDDGVVNKAVLETGDKIDIDMALIGIGAVLNVELFTGQLEMAHKQVRGIAVDKFLNTSDPNIYAVGDVAAVPYGRGQKRFEHVDHARQTADVAVKNLLIDCHNLMKNDTKASFEHKYLPYYYSRLFEYTDTPVIFKFYGSNGDDMEDVEVVQWGDMESTAVTEKGILWVDKTERVIGGLLCCATEEKCSKLRAVVQKHRRLTTRTSAAASKLVDAEKI